MLSGHTEEQVRQHVTNLVESQRSAAQNLQQSVHSNYRPFIQIAKEISTLEGDMGAIRDVMLGMRTVMDQLLGESNLAGNS